MQVKRVIVLFGIVKTICKPCELHKLYSRVDRQSSTCEEKNNTTHFYSLMGTQERLQYFFLLKHFAFFCHGEGVSWQFRRHLLLKAVMLLMRLCCVPESLLY